ncbi:MAG: M3 family metallopeptidase, partial [Burkholderiaceae bacterium]
REPASWANVAEPLTSPLDALTRAWGLVGHLQAVVDTPQLRAAYNANLPRVTEFWTRLSQDLRLFARYQQLAQSAQFAQLTPVRQRIVNNALRDFRLGGAELTGAARERFAQISARLAEVSQKFSENVLDVTNVWSKIITDRAQLGGVPEDALAAAAGAAQQDGVSGYKFTLHAPSYLPILQYCENRALREEMYRAFVTRASELGEPAYDNTALMREILSLRKEQAQLLGYANHAEVSLVSKMAGKPAEVMAFLHGMTKQAKPYAQRDMEQLRAFAKGALGMPDLQAWDVLFASEKLRQAHYSYSENDVKQYFTEPKVMAGLFSVIERLFDVRFEQQSAPVWHESVRFYTLTRGGAPIAHLYVDNYARAGKRSGAWMEVCRTRRKFADSTQTPVAYVTCNFASPVDGNAALLTHSDVITLFHEFGHALHHVLTQVDEPAADMRAVEWDAIELPSQFMENFCWEWDVVVSMSSHVSTGAPLPRELFEKMRAARNFQSGMFTMRQMEFAMFDMRAHMEFDPNGQTTLQQLLDEVRSQVAVVIPPAYNRFQHAFSHIFAGGYAAGYYSYKWAEVMSADAYDLFEQTGVLNPETGKRFLREVLEVGASRAAQDSFKAFRGRAPDMAALLRHTGMVPQAA